MTASLQLVPLTRSRRDIHRFLILSYSVYEGDPYWVAPMLMDVKKVFSDQNPFFQHAEMQLWMAIREGRDVGRIAAILDHNFNRSQKDSAAFFGFYECLNDPEASHALFDAVAGWAKARNLTRVLGPMNPTNNDECGLLVNGFGSSPVLMMTYNPAYYVDFVAAEGFQKAKDLFAYYIDLANSPRERLERIAAVFGKRQQNITIHPIRRKNMLSDLAKVKELYNAAWEDNWGFVPMTDAEIDFMAARLKPILLEEMCLMAESPTEPVAFMLVLPDYNQVFKPLKGRLFTAKFLGALPYFLGLKMVPLVRFIAFGIKREFRGRGIESMMMAEGLRFALKSGIKACEASWILEENVNVQRLIELFAGKPYKTYRIYTKSLQP